MQIGIYFMKKLLTFIFSASLAMIFTGSNSMAKIAIDITRGNVDPMPIALPYASSDNESNLSRDVIGVVESDLESSGIFRSIDRTSFIDGIYSKPSLPTFSNWRSVKASALVTSNIKPQNSSEFDLEFRLWDVFSEQQIAGKLLTTNKDNWRRISHLMADEIYSRLTGESGMFDSRIVYVSEYGSQTKRVKRLAIMDQDGANHRYLTDGKDLVITPRFSPNSQEIIYMSYIGGVPKVYMRNVDSGRVTLIGNFPGMSFSPRFSPDGKSVLMSVSIDGNSEIFEMNLKTKKYRRLTNNPAIDTSPSFSPEQDRIVFNSDRGGTQQLYVMNADGSNAKRISFSEKGRYGTPVWSPRGDLIAFTKMHRGMFYIGVMKPDGSGERLLTKSFLDEGPTWSPNGRVIIFARQTPFSRSSGSGGAWKLHSVDLTGRNERIVPTPRDGSDPAWSPLL